MKRIIVLLVFSSIFIIIFLNTPKYGELNNISVIDKITIKCNNDYYDVTLREVLLLRKDNGITFKYNYYRNRTDDIINIKDDYTKKYHKVFYYDKVKSLETNCVNTDIFKDTFNKKLTINKIKN